MVSYFNELRREGMSVDLAVIQGSALRLRPTLITVSVALQVLKQISQPRWVPCVAANGIHEIQRAIANAAAAARPPMTLV